MKGKIERLQLKGLNDGRQYLSVQIDGQVYSLWDKKYIDNLREGMEVEYQWKQNGNFRNLTEVDTDPDRPRLALNGSPNSTGNNHQYNNPQLNHPHNHLSRLNPRHRLKNNNLNQLNNHHNLILNSNRQ